MKINMRKRRMEIFSLMMILVWITVASGCMDTNNYEDFTNVDSYKREDAFRADSKICEAEKDKHSSKIQAREMGFEGGEAGYLGCMKLKGWTRIAGANPG